MTDDAIAELTPVLGSVRAACEAAGRPRANHYRRHRQSPKPDKPVRERQARPRALTPAERDTVRAVLNSPAFADMAPASVYHELLDEGVHLCSPSTMYRILHARNEVKERRRGPVPAGGWSQRGNDAGQCCTKFVGGDRHGILQGPFKVDPALR